MIVEEEWEWVFDPIPPSGAVQGGDPVSYLFRPTVDTLVRESVQNATDQRATDDPVRVVFTFEELSDAGRTQLLSATRWDELRAHLVGVADSPSLINGRVADALSEINQGRLVVLRIEDYGTRGLTGPEDGTEGNFAALCKHILVTTDDKSAGAGSHGLGKGVLWRFSSLSTVLFSSRYEEDGQNQFRVFGRAEFPFHSADSEQWAGPGWFGLSETVATGQRAVSVRAPLSPGLAKQLGIGREEDGLGTSVMIMGFSEPDEERQRPVVEVARDVLDSASRWFWPRLLDGTLQVQVRALVDGAEVFNEIASIEDADSGFITAMTASPTGVQALAPGDVAEAEIPVKIPTRRDSSSTVEIEGAVTLRVFRTDPDGVEDVANSIAMVRGAGMVVKYWKPGLSSLEGAGFRAVLLAGKAHGDSATDAVVEEFLRAAEPPAHDDWVHHTNNLKSRYRIGSKARLEELMLKVRRTLVELIETSAAENEAGPPTLANLFPLGHAGAIKKKHKFNVNFDSPILSNGEWYVSGTVSRNKGDRPWRVEFTASLEGESGGCLPLDIISITSDSRGAVTESQSISNALVLVSKTCTSIRFNLVARPSTDLANLALESRFRVDARPMETTV